MYSFFGCKKNGHGLKVEVKHENSMSLGIPLDSCAVLLASLIILDGIYAGIFTLTKANIMANVWVLIAGEFICRELD